MMAELQWKPLFFCPQVETGNPPHVEKRIVSLIFSVCPKFSALLHFSQQLQSRPFPSSIAT